MNYYIGDKLRFTFVNNETRVGTVKKITGFIRKKYLITVNYSNLRNILKPDKLNVYYYFVKEKDVIELMSKDFLGFN